MSSFPQRLSTNGMSFKSVKRTLRLKGVLSSQNCSTLAMLIPTLCLMARGFFGGEKYQLLQGTTRAIAAVESPTIAAAEGTALVPGEA